MNELNKLKYIHMKTKILLISVLWILIANINAQNPNFYIYLCFGQSNMEGQGAIEPQDRIVNSRFKVFQAINCPNLNRTKATWYTAVPLPVNAILIFHLPIILVEQW